MSAHRSLTFCLPLCLLTLATFHVNAPAAWSDDAAPPGAPTAPGSEKTDEDLFGELDLSEDGFLSGREAKDYLRFDLDGNKRITFKEFQTGRAKERAPAKPRVDLEKLFNSLDINQDGVLSGKEAKKFKQYDTDGDGEISKAEFVAGLTREPGAAPGKVDPSKLQTYRHLKETLSPKHVKNFVPFHFDFPAGWKIDPEAGTEKNSNMVKVERHIDLGGNVLYTQENFAVGNCEVPGEGKLAEISLQFLSTEFQRNVRQGFPQFKLNREGKMKFAGFNGYGFDFSSRLPHPTKGDVDCWGRVILIPAAEIKQVHGLAIILLATSEAPELKSLDDLGVKGELPIILNSFQVGSAATPPVAPARPLPPAPPRTN